MTTPPKAYAVRRISPTEHQLVAGRNLAAGELILHEQAVVHVPVGRYRYDTFVWDLIDKLLSDKALLAQYTRCQLLSSQLQLHAEDEVIEDLMVKKHHKSRRFVHELYLGVGTNNLGILDEAGLVRAYGVFPFLSRADHSCEPNAELTPANWRAGETALSAKRDIRAGEPLTWSYFREAEFLPQDWATRNYHLVNVFRFACRCARCKAERPNDVPSSQAGQVAYFDKLFMEQAKEMARSPDSLAHFKNLQAESPLNMHRKRLAERGLR
jgi:hypothetical protein